VIGVRVIFYRHLWFVGEVHSIKYAELAICTRPDADHIGGFCHVLEDVHIEDFGDVDLKPVLNGRVQFNKIEIFFSLPMEQLQIA